MGINEIFNKYKEIDITEFTAVRLGELKRILSSTEPTDLVSVQEHRMYIELVNKFRSALVEFDQFKGAKFSETLANLLAVGANGVYSDDLRFMYELIQNVDDCEYEDLTDCKLDIKFDINNGAIILTYNETGFTPFNVFSITGIAEESKNISPEKIEIGEKGIGFKSVFGIAEKVHIQSGKFSFILHKDNFTIPIPEYSSNYLYEKGTKLTIYLAFDKEKGNKESFSYNFYRKFVDEYGKEDSIFNKNPILFLNKLTSIKLYIDSFKSLTFNVDKGGKNVVLKNGLVIEEDVILRAQIYDYNNGQERNINKEIYCLRYTKDILYDSLSCISRYGNDTKFPYKKMKLQVVVPKIEELIKVKECGSLYSFLPTKIRTNVPISCHIPFKLDSSREWVDSQNLNCWFNHSIKEFSAVLLLIFKDLAEREKESIVHYLPIQNHYFFKIDDNNDKLKCLKEESLLGKRFLKEELFYTNRSGYKNSDEIFTFDKTMVRLNEEKFGELIESSKYFFNFPKESKYQPVSYGIDIRKDVYQVLFNQALENENLAEIFFKLIYQDENFNYKSLIENTTIKNISIEVIEIMSKYKNLFYFFNKNMLKSNGSLITFSVKNVKVCGNIMQILSKQDIQDFVGIKEEVLAYLKKINFNCCYANLERKSYFVANNVVVLSKNQPLSSLVSFFKKFDTTGHLYVDLILARGTYRLNNASNEMSDSEYMDLLINMRKSAKNALGEAQYTKYFKLMSETGVDFARYFQELIQNADDCKYEDNILPTFSLSANGLKMETHSNEMGFSKKNVRAITAIGETTKKGILSQTSIGEKGIGFKSIFTVADKVEIQSNDFNFVLHSNEPTIPVKLKNKTQQIGTKMLFDLKKQIDLSLFKPEKLVSLCLCLRKLKKLLINNQTIIISDEKREGKDYRIIDIEGVKYEFISKQHEFKIDSDKIKLKQGNQEDFNTTQSIIFYIPTNKDLMKKYYLYSGLPTLIEIGVPLVIDAPFELTSSRENILENSWNKYIASEMYIGYANMLEENAVLMRQKIFELLRFESLQYGSIIKFTLFKSNDFLNNAWDCISYLRQKKIVPTYDKEIFVSSNDNTAFRYPLLLCRLIRNYRTFENNKYIVDVTNKDYDAICKNLGVVAANGGMIIDLIENTDIKNLLKEDSYRKEFYDYLVEDEEMWKFNHLLKDIPFIPVKSKNEYGDTQYIQWNGNTIYTEENKNISSDEYYVLDTTILSKNFVERILSVQITVMNDEYKKGQYDNKLRKIIKDENKSNVYRTLRIESILHLDMLKNSKGELLVLKNEIYLMNQLGELKQSTHLYMQDQEDVFNGNLFKKYLISKESKQLARILEVKSIKEINAYNFNIENELLDEDVKDILNSNIYGKHYILQQFIYDRYISEELIKKYNLQGIKPVEYEMFDEDDFPTEPIINIEKLNQFIEKEAANTSRIVDAIVERIVPKIEEADGKLLEIDNWNIRNRTMKKYEASSNSDVCFCQMCLRAKNKSYIEVNNIQLKPEFYWPQMRIALCLECSKKFKRLRENSVFLTNFHQEIQSCDVNAEPYIEINIGNESVKFTQTHIAEIRAIFNSDKC